MSDRKMATRGRTPLHGKKKQLLTKMVPAVVRRIKAAAAMRDKTASMLFEEISREWLQRNETSASQGKSRPLMCFAGIWTNWTSVRKVKEGESTNDLYAFLTTEPNAEVGAIHPKAMPVILTTPNEVESWMTAPADESLKLQRPLPDGALKIVAKGGKEDAGMPKD